MTASNKKPAVKGKMDIVKTIQLRDDVAIEGEIVSREAPLARNENFNKSMVVQPILNDAQLSIMLNKTPEWAVKQRVGGGGKQYTYVPHGYVTDTLNKAFGFDWDLILDPMHNGQMYAMEIEEIVNPTTSKVMKTNRHIAVCGRLVVRIRDPKTLQLIAEITKSGFGSQLWLPAMELGDALKGARSDLIKTCAYQFGIALDLYWNERAEISEFENVAREAELKKENEKKMADLQKSGVPTNFGVLIAKAKSDHDLSVEEIEQILGVEIDALMGYSAEDIVKAWNVLISAASKKEG